MSAPVQNHPCVACGQLDDHPKIQHLGAYINESGVLVADDTAATYHHDCYPFPVRGNSDRDEHARKIIEKAKAGVHGDDLRKFIDKTAPKVGA